MAPTKLKRIAANFIVRHGFTIKAKFLSKRAEKQEGGKLLLRRTLNKNLAKVSSWRISTLARRLAAALGFRFT